MKKMIGTISITATIVMVAWVISAILYFTAVSAHFNNEEHKEDADKNRYRQPGGYTRVSKRIAKPDDDDDISKGELDDFIREAIREVREAQTIQRTATGRFNGSKLWRST